MFGLVPLSTPASTCDLVTMNFEANIHPPLTILPHPVGPSTSSANSADQIHALHITDYTRLLCSQPSQVASNKVNCTVLLTVCVPLSVSEGNKDVKGNCIRTTDIDSGRSSDSLYRVIHKSVKHLKTSQHIHYSTDHGSSYADTERNSPSFFFIYFTAAQFVHLW